MTNIPSMSPEIDLLTREAHKIVYVLELLTNTIHDENRKWWYDGGNRLERNKGELIALMHSELSEMLEGVRKSCPDTHLTQWPMEYVEAADLLIRLMDYCGAYNIPVGTIMMQKLIFNRTREDHQKEAREKAHGKKF